MGEAYSRCRLCDPLVMQIDDAQAQTWFPRLDVRGQKLTPPMPDPSELLTESTQRLFADGMAPDGTSWVLMRGQSCLCGSEWWRQRLFAADHGGAVRLSRQHGDASMRPRLFAADHGEFRNKAIPDGELQ